MSVTVHVYRHCVLQRRYGDFTEILLTFVMSINGSSFPVSDWCSHSAFHPRAIQARQNYKRAFERCFVPRFARNYSGTLRARSARSGASWVRKFCKLSIREILAAMSASIRPSIRTLRRVEVEGNSSPLP